MTRRTAIFLTLMISLLAGISSLSANVSAPIHATAKAPNGASDQITNLASGGITATPQRDGANRITGYIWSNGTNTVTQSWQRGAGGRIEFAGSDVGGAPTFDYLLDPQDPAESFDSFGRRLKCQTAGGAWTYVYGLGGQITSATHPTLGTFSYSFDGIGRRTDKGAANISDVMNRTTAWTNTLAKTLTIKAHPNARVWFNGTEIQNFTGQHQAALGTPGASGQWVPWETLAVLEGAGEGAGSPPANPLASPDAKAEKRGAAWIPPAAETLTYDAAGNRQSSAQWDYGWDAKNQLARIRTKSHTAAAQAFDIRFTYDSEGRRVRKHVIEYASGAIVSEETITFVWDGWDLLYERHQLPSGLTTLERKYLWGPDIADGAAGGAGGLLLIRETKGSTTTEIIPLYDGTGHVVALTDINKNLLAEYAYGPFGEKITATGPLANSNPWRYATKYLDEETGLYYFGKRYLDPITGQWLSREPLGEGESVNLYSYCHNDPINHVDILGLWQSDEWGYVGDVALFYKGIGLAGWGLVKGVGTSVIELPENSVTLVKGTYWNITDNTYRMEAFGVVAETAMGMKRAATDYGVQLSEGKMEDLGGATFHVLSTFTPFVASKATTATKAVNAAEVVNSSRLVQSATIFDDATVVSQTLSSGGTGLNFTQKFGFIDEIIPSPGSGVWSKNPLQRGTDIEAVLAKTDYKDWFNAGTELNNGYFPLIDFQKGRNLVSLKTVDTGGASWMGRMKSHIRELALGHTVDGNAATMILDMRVQPGGAGAAESLIEFGRKRGVTVLISEYP